MLRRIFKQNQFKGIPSHLLSGPIPIKTLENLASSNDASSILKQVNGDTHTLYLAGRIFSTSIHTQSIAKRLFEAGSGSNECEYGLAMLNIKHGNIDAMESIIKLAKRGYPDACYYLGMLRLSQSRVVEALKLFRVGQENHHASQYQLGILYLEGLYVPIDKQAGIQWIEKSARGSFPKALGKLGEILMDPELATYTQDNGDPIQYLTTASTFGEKHAQYHLAKALIKSKKGKMGLEYLQMACTQSLPEAAFEMGLLSLDGELVPLDSTRAKTWFEATINWIGSSPTRLQMPLLNQAKSRLTQLSTEATPQIIK